MVYEFRKSKTDMGSPVKTDLPDKEHNHVVTIVDRMEKMALKQSKGRYTLQDIYRDPKLRKKFMGGRF